VPSESDTVFGDPPATPLDPPTFMAVFCDGDEAVAAGAAVSAPP
jgi:hypothetical protein